MKLIALTAHDVNILKADVEIEEVQVKGRPALIYKGQSLENDIILRIPGSGVVPKVADTQPTEEVLMVGDIAIPLSKISGKQITDLPEPKPETAFICSSFTQSAAKELGRNDIYAPADIICTMQDDGSTTIVGTRGLKQ